MEQQNASQFIEFAQEGWVTSISTIRSKYVYEFVNSGVYSWVYANSEKKLVKIIRYKQDANEMAQANEMAHANEMAQFIEKRNREAFFQYKAAQFGLAPKVYTHGFIPGKKGNPFIDFGYYYIIMDDLLPIEWGRVFADDIPHDAREFIEELVTNAHLYNDVDPLHHLFRHNKTGQLNIIDFRHFNECGFNLLTCIRLMEKALNIALE